MRNFAFLALLLVACNVSSTEQLNKAMDEVVTKDGTPTIPISPDDNNVNSILLILWTELNDISEQVKLLAEKTDTLESAMILMTNRMGKLEDDLEENSQKLNEVTSAAAQGNNDSSDITNELQQMNEKLAEQDEKLSELDNSIQSNATQLYDQDIAMQQDLLNMTQQYQQDFAEVNNKISELELCCEQCQGLNETVSVNETVSYRYEISQNDGYSWDTARQYCMNQGGDLAFHNLDTIDKREQIICNTLGWCDDHYADYLYWGVHKRQGTSDIWEYLDGKVAYDSDIIWYNETQKSEKTQDCGYMLVATGSSHHMKVLSYVCDSSSSIYYAFCEFEV